jgi:hypothetical protein
MDAGYGSTVTDLSTRRKVLRASLESARSEVQRQLEKAELPTSMPISARVVLDPRARERWSVGPADEMRSAVADPFVRRHVGENNGGWDELRIRPQLQPFARLLAETTPLGVIHPMGFSPRPDAIDNAMTFFAQPLATAYLAALPDVAAGDPHVVERLADELDTLIERGAMFSRSQLVFDGIDAVEPLFYRNVELTPLRAEERDRYVLSTAIPGWDRDLPVPHQVLMFRPRVRLATLTSPEESSDASDGLAHRLCLALFLAGFDIKSTGVRTTVQEPSWAAFGTVTSPFPVRGASGFAEDPPTIDKPTFRRIVDTAYSIPHFTDREVASKQIALARALRGLGADKDGFLDLMIALEAALLGGADRDLAYRFRLHGAIFLRNDRAPEATLKDLKTIYDTRSKLVHGSEVRNLGASQELARELTIAVIKRSISSGWPDSKTLDTLAVNTPDGSGDDH